MSDAWQVVFIAGLGSCLIRGVGPVLVGGKALPPLVLRLVGNLAPALFAALIVTQTFGGQGELRLDERALGLIAAAVALSLRAPIAVVVVAAAAVTALARVLSA